MYHRIADLPYDPWGLAVTPSNFADQLRCLRQVRKLVPMDQLVDGVRTGDLSGNEVAITFDDGYVDNLTVARPLLESAGVPATVFITTDRLGAAREFWWDELAHMCLGGTQAVDTEVGIAGHVFRIALAARETVTATEWFWSELPGSERERTYLELWKALRPLDEQARDACMETLRSCFGERPAAPGGLPMRREDVRALVAGGLIQIGGHACSHLPLPTLSTAAKWEELERCRSDLELLSGQAVHGFAYPFGDRDDETRALTRQAGYAWAVSTHSASVDRGHDLFDLPRMQARNWTGAELMRRLAGLERTA